MSTMSSFPRRITSRNFSTRLKRSEVVYKSFWTPLVKYLTAPTFTLPFIIFQKETRLSISAMLLKATIAAAIATLVAQTATALPLEGEFPPRIFGGKESPPGSFPFLVAILKRGDYFCAGSLLNNDTVLTAGHCFGDGHKQIQVRAGSNVRFASLYLYCSVGSTTCAR